MAFYVTHSEYIHSRVTTQGFITLVVAEASQGRGRREFLQIIVKYRTENSATTRPSQGAGLIQGRVSFKDIRYMFVITKGLLCGNPLLAYLCLKQKSSMYDNRSLGHDRLSNFTHLESCTGHSQ